jgi:gamma-glutamylcyclotransferase (GGCT)/AIG2-like uncharacterized protein YtfP
MTLELYFAYGSNMSGAELARRLGRGDATGFERRRGVLVDHVLAFNKVSSTDPRIGYATVVPQPGRSVEGVLNLVTPQDLLRLDLIELVPHHYRRTIVSIWDPAGTRNVDAQIYVSQPDMDRAGLLPTSDYLLRLRGGRDIVSRAYDDFLAGIACHTGCDV